MNNTQNKTHIPRNSLLVTVDEHTYLGLAVLSDTVGETMELIAYRILQTFVESQLSTPPDEDSPQALN